MGSIILFILIVSWICVVYAKKQKPKEGGSGSGVRQAPGSAGGVRQTPGNTNYSQSRPGNVNYSQSGPGNTNYSQSRPGNTNYSQSGPGTVNYSQNRPGNGSGSRPAGNTGYGQRLPESAAARQQMLKSRLQQKYAGRPLSAYSAQSMQKNNKSAENILERAKNNVKENETDELRTKTEGNRAASSEAFADSRSAAAGVFEEERNTFPAGYQNGVLSGLISEESELIRQINDLMVTGYSGELTFERDFIAEGIEMLNRFEIPNS